MHSTPGVWASGTRHPAKTYCRRRGSTIGSRASTTASRPWDRSWRTCRALKDGNGSRSCRALGPGFGSAVPLMTGWVVASVRKIDEERSKRGPNGDYVDPVQALDLIPDYQPVVPDQPATIDFGTFPLDGVLQPGHRLRVSVF